MNIYRKERIEMITAMMMAIAGISEKKAFELLKSTVIYQNILRGEECTLYESYSANLQDVVEELQDCGKGELVKKINENSILGLNKWIYDNKVQNARQLKKRISINATSIREARNPEMISLRIAKVADRRKSRKDGLGEGGQFVACKPAARPCSKYKSPKVASKAAKSNRSKSNRSKSNRSKMNRRVRLK